MTAPVMTRSGVPAARLATACPIDSRMTFPPPNTASSPPAHRSRSTSISSEVSASLIRSPAVGPYSSAYRSRLSSLTSFVLRTISASKPPPADLQPRHHSSPAQRHQRNFALDARLEPHRGAGRDVQPTAPGKIPVEPQRRVGLREVKVRPDLNRPVAGVRDHQRHHRTAKVQSDRPVAVKDLAGDHGMGSWTVTSLVPSGKVASTCTSVSISGTPSITSSRLSTVRPVVISSTTGRPSLAPSSRNDVISATASGEFSRRPRAPAPRAGPRRHVDQQTLLLMRGDQHASTITPRITAEVTAV